MAYASGDDLVKRYDADLVGDSATDDRSTIARSEVPQHPAVIAALAGASGRINSALNVGGKYTTDMLEALITAGGDDAEYLKDLVCDLAMVRLCTRRGENQLGDYLKELREHTEELLDLLRRGVNIFALPEVIDASLVDTDGPTAIDLRDRNALPERMGRYFPAPVTRLPSSQGGE